MDTEDMAKRILDEISGLIGDDVRKRQEAIIRTWLETVARQERERRANLESMAPLSEPNRECPGRLCERCGIWSTSVNFCEVKLCLDCWNVFEKNRRGH